ncbi:hypothetical protein ACVFI8_10940 [Agarivorans sp. MS3-6]
MTIPQLFILRGQLTQQIQTERYNTEQLQRLTYHYERVLDVVNEKVYRLSQGEAKDMLMQVAETLTQEQLSTMVGL